MMMEMTLLDPANDGVEIKERVGHVKRGIVISTNRECELRDEAGVAKIIEDLKDVGGCQQIGNTPFVLVYNKERVLQVGDECYFTGSALIIKGDGEDFDLLYDREIIPAINAFKNRMVWLVAGDIEFEAYRLQEVGCKRK